MIALLRVNEIGAREATVRFSDKLAPLIYDCCDAPKVYFHGVVCDTIGARS